MADILLPEKTIVKPGEQHEPIRVSVMADLSGGIKFDLGAKGSFVLPPQDSLHIAVAILRYLGHNVTINGRQQAL